MSARYPITPDGRYFVASGRLWRRTDPRLDDATEKAWVSELMSARRAVAAAETDTDIRRARDRVQHAKEALGERGPVWWSDAAPDDTGRAPHNTRYADWWADLNAAARDRAQD